MRKAKHIYRARGPRGCSLSHLFLGNWMPVGGRENSSGILVGWKLSPGKLVFPSPHPLQHYAGPSSSRGPGPLPHPPRELGGGSIKVASDLSPAPGKLPQHSLKASNRDSKLVINLWFPRKSHISAASEKRRLIHLSHKAAASITLGSHDNGRSLQCTRYCASPSDASPLPWQKSFPLIPLHSPGT